MTDTKPEINCSGVYLLHFEPRYKNAGHYLGFAEDIGRRVYEHEFGQSNVALVGAAVRAGVSLRVARTWPGATRELERKLKGRRLLADGSHSAHRGSLVPLCPVCQQERNRRPRATQ